MRPRFENVLQPQADGPAVPRPGGWRRLALTEEARDRDSASILACGLPVPATVDQARSRPWAAGTTEGGVRPPAQRTRARQSLFSRAGETHSGGRGGAGVGGGVGGGAALAARAAPGACLEGAGCVCSPVGRVCLRRCRRAPDGLAPLVPNAPRRPSRPCGVSGQSQPTHHGRPSGQSPSC